MPDPQNDNLLADDPVVERARIADQWRSEHAGALCYLLRRSWKFAQPPQSGAQPSLDFAGAFRTMPGYFGENSVKLGKRDR